MPPAARPADGFHGTETTAQLIIRLRSLTVEVAADVLEDAQVSDPLSAEDVYAV